MGGPPAIEQVAVGRICRRYRTGPLVAFVKGHLTVVSRASTKIFDGWFKNIRQKRGPSKKSYSTLFMTLFGPFLCSRNSYFYININAYCLPVPIFGPSDPPFWSV